MPTFIEQVQKSKDDTTKRVAIDAIYSIGAHLTNEILEHKQEILACLDKCRTDKSQPVRAAAQETIKLIKDLDNQRSFDGSDDNKLNFGEIDDDDIKSTNLRLLDSETKSTLAASTTTSTKLEPKMTKPYLIRSRSPITFKKEAKQQKGDASKEEEQIPSKSKTKPPTVVRKRRNSGDLSALAKEVRGNESKEDVVHLGNHKVEKSVTKNKFDKKNAK